MLDWHTVKELEKEYMAELLRKVGIPTPTIIEVDEISIHNGHTYWIVASDPERKWPIWFGEKGRSTEGFREWIGLSSKANTTPCFRMRRT